MLSRAFRYVALPLVLLVGSYFGYMEEQGNFHVVTPGEAYRSAQLDRDEWIHYIKKYNIKSIVNLRGAQPGAKWYEEELSICKELKLAHYDVPLDAHCEPSPEEMNQLLKVFKEAPRPVLFHCKSGADRSGFASAIWKLIVDKAPPSEAKKQLSFKFFHLPFGPAKAMDRAFDKFVKEFQEKKGYVEGTLLGKSLESSSVLPFCGVSGFQRE